MIWGIRLIATSGIVNISLNNFNFIMLMLCVLLCWTPNVLGKCCADAIGNIWGVVIQFRSMRVFSGLITQTGLNEVIVHFFTSISSQETFPLIAYIYSGLLNLVVPSGGSKFIIEAPYIMEVCTELDVSIARIIDAYNFADLNTNIIQPFWGLAFLAMCSASISNRLSRIRPLLRWRFSSSTCFSSDSFIETFPAYAALKFLLHSPP